MTLSEQRARLVRILAGAVLAQAEDLSEIQAFCSLLAMDSLIATNSAQMALAAIAVQDGRVSPKALLKAQTEPPLTSSIDDVILMLRSIGISKRHCLDAMRKANPKFAAPAGFDKMAMKDLVRRFRAQSSPDQMARFVGMVSPNDLDPYLSGIERRG